VYLIRILITFFVATFLFVGTALAEPALFEVSDEDTSIYVLGTVHLLDPDMPWRSDAIDTAFDEADAVYFEADVYGADPQDMQALVVQYGLLDQGTTLPSMMSKDDWEMISSFSQNLGLPSEALATMRPWLASITLSTLMSANMDLTANGGVDFSLYSGMNGTGIERRYLETVEEQIVFIADLAPEVELNMLIETVADAEEGMELLGELVEAWFAGDVDRVDELANGSMMDGFPEVYEAIIVGRNLTWAEELDGLMEIPGTYFVAIGAAHVPGEHGILNLMREAGYNVSRH